MKSASASASRAARLCLALATAFLALSLVPFAPAAAARATEIGEPAATGGFLALSERVAGAAAGSASASTAGTASDAAAATSASAGSTVLGGSAAKSQVASIAVPQASMVFELRGQSPYEYPVFTFTLKAEKSSYPMPASASGSTMSCTLEGAGTVDFGSIDFTKAGVYTYKISQEAGKDPDWRYDTSVFHLKVVVSQGDDGLSAHQTLSKGSSSETVESASFTNVYSPASTAEAPKLGASDQAVIAPADPQGSSDADGQGAAGDEAEGTADGGAAQGGQQEAADGQDGSGGQDGDAQKEDGGTGRDSSDADASAGAPQPSDMRPEADTVDPVEAPAVKQGFEPGAENPLLTAVIVAVAVVVVGIGGTAGMTWLRTRRPEGENA